MAYEKRDGDGTLFINGYKQKDTHPDMRGELLLDGKTYEVAGWKKSTKAGDPWYSLKVQPKREKSPGGPAQRIDAPQPLKPEFSDDIPW